MDTTEFTAKVKAEAYRLGFHLAGAARPEFPYSYPVYAEWLAKGYHGEMGYLATDRAQQRREDIHQILPEVESILVLGMRYWPQSGETQPGQGRVAAYAWNQDYHDVFKARLEALVAFIQAEAGREVPHRWYTDTGPILERDLAWQAGLGWIGKNSMLIHPQIGSYFFLAEVLLGVELEVDAPLATDHCGTCTRCIEACPTGCILPNRTLDARRCISYLTIELKGAIPQELRPQMGDWVFGCDVCQQVCPWNLRFAPEQGDAAFAPRQEFSTVGLIEEIGLSPQAFNLKFKDSPVKRAKRRGYLRNAAVALGNAGDPAAVPALRKVLLEDGEPLVRRHAAWALGQVGGGKARQALEGALEGEQDEAVVEEIRGALDLIEAGR